WNDIDSTPDVLLRTTIFCRSKRPKHLNRKIMKAFTIKTVVLLHEYSFGDIFAGQKRICMKSIFVFFYLVFFSAVYARELPSPITLVNNSSEFELYNPFALIYSQSFYLGNDPITQKVGPFACNIRNHLQPVPEAWSMVKTYRSLRIMALSLLLSGLGITGTGLYLSFNDNETGEPHPLFFIGLGFSVSASIPGEISKFLISIAVEKYNRAIKSSR
ncbi:MAG: hypothetical protein JXA71_10450, partial [Chitinispirillaceae bacterium]|nr:hypothetical protein [Chitinispirillaceae bacterium]